MKFSRYSSIENSYRLKTVYHIMETCANMNFVVQEKIHGSNFSIYTDGKTVRYLNGIIGNLIRPNFANIVDGTY